NHTQRWLTSRWKNRLSSARKPTDVFSGKNTATMIGGLVGPISVYLSCDGEHQNKLAVIFKVKDGVAEGINGEIVLKADDGEVSRFQSKSYDHNDKYGGFAAELTPDEAKKLIAGIKVAKKRVIIGLQVPGVDMKISHTLNVSGSKKASETYAKACDVGA
ncbi:hypothetical protein, partial [Rhizobium sp. FKY42]|uniref:hypothetical protein n=1 Tax=Rhizobium sp. FKY42 TaxID=2562310 RepID=UPI00197EFF5D